MKKKIYDLKNTRKTLLDEASAAVESNDMELYNSKMEEVNAINSKIEALENLLGEDERFGDIGGADPFALGDPQDGGETETANALRAVIKACMGRGLTEAENSLLVRTPGSGDGNGEGYLLPQDIRTIIQEKIRQYKSLRAVLGYMPTTALTGSYPVEDFETLSELVDFTDGNDGAEVTDIKFKNVTFALKQKGALLGLSNTLLQMTDNNLIEYVAKCFAKKAVITENKMAIAALKKGKTAKALTGFKDLKSSINRDLDEGIKYGAVIVTNQDGFDALDKELDETGRPILQPVVTDPTKKTFAGLPVIVYSNAMLPTVVNKAPVFYGNLSEAVDFIDNSAYSFALSEHAGFKANMTYARVIEYVDVVQKDNSDKIYIYGEFSVNF